MNLRKVFGLEKATPVTKIAFYKEASHFGCHGKIVVSSPAKKLKEIPVNFVFIGRERPPALTMEAMQMLWEEAAVQGYIPLEITAYGAELSSVQVMEATQADLVTV